MKTTAQKWMKAAAITAAALQIPLLMLWKIILDSLMGGSSLLQHRVDPLGNSVYELVFKWELFWKSLGIHLPILLASAHPSHHKPALSGN